MKKTFKYRIYFNSRTLENVENWLNLCRNLYNTALQQRIMVYKQNHKSLSYYDQQNELPELKQAITEYKEVCSQVLQNVIRRLDNTFRAFYHRIGSGEKLGFPRFKAKNRYDSFTFPNKECWKLQGKYLYVSKLGVFKLHLSRPIQGDIKTVTIKRSQSNKWYACFSCDNVPEKKLSESDKSVGIDVGIKSFCVDSVGNKTDNPLYMRQAESILHRKQRVLSHRVKGSNRRSKARILVAKVHDKITNQRLDFLHKLANEYIKNYGTIIVEDLVIKNMVQNHHLAKSISDSSWGKFFELLTYKAEEAGRKVIKVKPHNTSQLCSNCGENVGKTLAERTHSCPYCGLVIDRDENAARNILAFGQNVQALTKEVALCVA